MADRVADHCILFGHAVAESGQLQKRNVTAKWAGSREGIGAGCF
jgi:hypothetical protein